MNEHTCESYGQLLLEIRNAGRQGHLVQSLDDRYKRLIGFLDVEAGIWHHCRLWLVKYHNTWGGAAEGTETGMVPAPDEPLDDILTSMDLTKETLRTRYIRSNEQRQDLAARFTGRKPTSEEIIALETQKQQLKETYDVVMDAHRRENFGNL